MRSPVIADRRREALTRSARRVEGVARAHPAFVVLALAAIGLSACSRNEPPATRAAMRAVDPKYGTSPSPRLFANGQPIPKGGGFYKVGAPYQIAGRWYVPREETGYDRTGIASWYGDDFHGRKTANGEIYDMRALSAAHPTLPMPSYAWVTNLDSDRSILVRINDRGPYANDRVIDLSRASARALGYENRGLSRVRVRYAGPAPLNGDDRREIAHLSAQPWYGSLSNVRGYGVARRQLPYIRPYAEPNNGLASREGIWRPTRTMASTDRLLPAGVDPAQRTRSAQSDRIAVVIAGLFPNEQSAQRRMLELTPHARLRIAMLTGAAGPQFAVRSEPMDEASANDLVERLQLAGIRDARLAAAGTGTY